MTVEHRCLLVVFVFCLLVHPSSSWDFSQGRRMGPGNHGQRLLTSSGKVAGTMYRVDTTFASRAEKLAHMVKQSAARSKRLSAVSFATLATNDSAPVSGIPEGYAMELQLGTPPQTFSLVPDTGSDLIWLQCTPCDTCFDQPDPIFDPSLSSTYSTVSCDNEYCTLLQQYSEGACDIGNVCAYNYGPYGDGSTTAGTVSTDTATLNGNVIPSLTFGCATNSKGNFGSTDGIVGLDLGALSLPVQLQLTSGTYNFLYCLPTELTTLAADPVDTVNGTIVFGADAIPIATIVYTPLVQNELDPMHYYVNLVDITVGTTPLGLPSDAFAINPTDGSGGLIFDSGTTITMLDPAGYTPLKTALQDAITYPTIDTSMQTGFDLCYDVTGITAPVFPVVTFNFDMADFVLPTFPNTFTPVTEAKTIYCLAMAATDTSLPLSIFGSTQQQGFQHFYDVDNSQLGWAGPGSC